MLLSLLLMTILILLFIYILKDLIVFSFLLRNLLIVGLRLAHIKKSSVKFVARLKFRDRQLSSLMNVWAYHSLLTQISSWFQSQLLCFASLQKGQICIFLLLIMQEIEIFLFQISFLLTQSKPAKALTM